MSSLRERLLRKIPSVDEILKRPEITDLTKAYHRTVMVEAIRKGLGRLRRELLEKEDLSTVEDGLFSFENLLPLFRREIENQIRPRLCRIINATGIVIHTNLGRSPLHPSALQHLTEISLAYSNLEYDLDRGERGSRNDHVEGTLCRLSGAESGLVVNNNAGAVLLALNTFAEGKEVVVSRGELVEIGGAFRIPDVMRRSGAVLREVGTTNRTYPDDYLKAIGPETALLLKVHTSNFRVMGFTFDTPLEDLVGVGNQHQLPVMNDLGSGCLVDLSKYGLQKEPTVQEAVKAGADIVTFSGDKLLGGPQAGIVVGKKKLVDAMKTNPLARALRIDKLTLAALESTLLLYLDEERAVEEIPTLRMLKTDPGILKKRANRLLRKLPEEIKERAEINLKENTSQVGGGALPLQELPTIVLALRPLSMPVNRFEEELRNGEPPIVSRISKDEVILDMRTVLDEEIPLLAKGIVKALSMVDG
ncbi:MAG: L-seryl-tRNA(Sec) selenium transferase [Deltaproteobacteria bacterium RBG_13_52_11b]|nr:MAG: L-seryl-tRNA(Sec) selenium transferase [Deltaproteobacteria bacterium RBG_13_52_11b]